MDYLREIKKTCSRLGVGYAAFLVVGLLLQMEAGSTGKYGLEGRLEYLDCDSGITAHVFARNADMLVDCEGYGNSVQTPEAAVRCGEAGGCFFCLHQHYVHREYHRNCSDEYREWNSGEASRESGQRAD